MANTLEKSPPIVLYYNIISSSLAQVLFYQNRLLTAQGCSPIVPNEVMSFVIWFKKGSPSFFKISSFLNKYISINLSLWSEHIKFMIILWQISCQRCYISSCLDIIYLLSNTKTNKQLHDNYYFLNEKLFTFPNHKNAYSIYETNLLKKTVFLR